MSNSTPEDSSTVDLDCAVCLQVCNHPTQLPCGHIFCFLCVKGVAIQSKRCAMCRAEIPTNYWDHPMLLERLTPTQMNSAQNEDVYQWYYEGRNGWWKYDERSNTELELACSKGDTECSLLVAGSLYDIDFQSMTQVRRSDQTRRRRVRRDTPLLPAKGIAGIKTETRLVDQTKSDDALNMNNEDHLEPESTELVQEVVHIPDNTPVSIPVTDDAIADIAVGLRAINLNEADSPGG